VRPYTAPRREDDPLSEHAANRGSSRGRPRPWHHDYLHLRPIARDLVLRLGPAAREGHLSVLLDVGSGAAPYRDVVAASGVIYVRCDADVGTRPDVAGRAESLPFGEGVFDAVLSTQLLGLVDDPRAMAREVARVLRPGGRAWITAPAAYPFDAGRVEHRFGEPELAELFAELTVVEIVREGGMLALPFVLANDGIREAMRAARRRLGVAGRLLEPPAALFFLLANGAGRLFEGLAGRGPLAPFLGYLDGRLPMNFLVVAEKRR
jgi:SAM-dependent methyltransferase